MRLVLLPAVLALLRGRNAVPAGRPSLSGTKEIPEWELAYYNKTKDVTAATWGTAGGGACLPFTGGCGHLLAMCGMSNALTEAQGSCRTYGQNVSAAFHSCKLEALNASSTETTFFQECLAEHFPATECDEVCAGVTAGPGRLRCLEECQKLGMCFSQCTVEYPWPTAVGDCASNCMGPVPSADPLQPGTLVEVIPANHEAAQTWQVHDMKLAGNLANMTNEQVAVLNTMLVASIAKASGVPPASVRILQLKADTEAPAAGFLQQPLDSSLSPVGDPAMPGLEAAGLLPAASPAPEEHIITVEFEVLAAHVDPQVLGQELTTAGHVLLSVTNPDVGDKYDEDLQSVTQAAGLDPPTEDQKQHAEHTGTIVSIDVLKGILVRFKDLSEVYYPAAALVIPETNTSTPCTSLRCGYLKAAHNTMGNVAYHMDNASTAGDSMINSTRVVASIVDAFTPAPTGPPPTPFPWDYFRKRLITSSDDPFTAFMPPTPMPSAAVLRMDAMR